MMISHPSISYHLMIIIVVKKSASMSHVMNATVDEVLLLQLLHHGDN